MYKRAIGGWAKHWDFILLDTLCLQLAYFIAFFIRFHSFAVYTVVGNRTTYRTTGLVLLLLPVVIAILFHTMHNVLRRGFWEEVKSTIIQGGLVFASIVVLIFTDKASDNISRIVLYTTTGVYLVLSFIIRLIYKSILIRYKKLSKNRELVLVGDEKGIEKALAAFEAHPETGISVKKIVRVDKGELDGAAEYIRNEWIDEVYVAVADPSLTPFTLISQCDEMAVTVHQQMFTGVEVKGKQWVDKIAKQPVLTTSINIPQPRELMLKRLVDIIAGFFMSLAAGIVLLIVTPMIKKSSPGPVLLKLERIGLNGKRFRMYMIRTMYVDADNRLKDWQEKNPGEKLTTRNDPRFIGNENGKTGIGVRIRKLGLDELPKGFNVLLGSMSLVGTRAPSVEEWEKYEFRHRARLSCKPGITGLWQASGKSRTMSFEEATVMDTEYIMNWSLGLDWRILFKTATLKQ